MQTDYTKLIDRYLSGEMSATEQHDFEQQLATNETLKAEVALQQSIYEVAQRASFRNTVKQTAKNYHFFKWLKWIGVSVLALLAVVTALMLVVSDTKDNENEVLDSHVKKTNTLEAKESEEKLIQIDSLSNAELIKNESFKTVPNVDRKKSSTKQKSLIDNLKTQDFKWEGKDTLFVSENGVLVSVPAKALLKDGAPYTGVAVVEWQEAMDGASIMKAGLSTMAGSNLLETQGMFSLRITDTEGNELEVNPNVGVYVQAPVDAYKPGMKLYDGEYNQDSVINWVNPVPLEKIPVPVPMSELNFYPAGYEDTLDNLKLSQEKAFRDSLYLACEYEEGFDDEPIGDILDENEKIMSEENQLYSSDYYDYLFNSDKDDENNDLHIDILYEEKLIYNKPIVKSTPLIRKIDDKKYQIDIEFNIKEGFSLLESLPLFNFGGYNINPIDTFYYNVSEFSDNSFKLSSTFQLKQNVYDLRFYIKFHIETNIDSKISQNECNNIYVIKFPKQIHPHIPPSKVLSFWKPTFDNTILATREFERRMQTIHGICKEELLAKYIKNIDKPMWFTDSILFKRGHKEFEMYFAERVGGMDANNPHTENLKRFYEEGVRELKANLAKLRKEEREKEKAWDDKVKDERQHESIRRSERETQAYHEEVALNHKRVSRQLGFTQGFLLTSNVRIVNIDREVYEATRQRKTTTISFEGKTSTIQYNDFSFTVEEANTFEQLYAYILPNKLNSYQRIQGQKGVFNYPLNDKISYDVVVLGINETGFYFHEIHQINEGDFGSISLQPISEAEFDKRISRLNQNRLGAPMSMNDELNWLKLERENYSVQRQREEKRQFLERMRKVVFPCYEGQERLKPIFR